MTGALHVVIRQCFSMNLSVVYISCPQVLPTPLLIFRNVVSRPAQQSAPEKKFKKLFKKLKKIEPQKSLKKLFLNQLISLFQCESLFEKCQPEFISKPTLV